jgi:BirA family biotin operon repressor/biotin-[acetyl-CoA-carboxylase] ligase
MRLFPPARFRLELVNEIGSTNEELLNRRGQPGFHGSALLALKQTAGYGRRGRDWQSGEGNLALSLALSLPPTAAPITLLTFLAGLALFEQAERHLPAGADLRLKWPNDLYLNGRKLAGMLAQGRQALDRNDVVLGLGVNLKFAPATVPATSLADYGPAPDPEGFALGFLLRFEKALAAELDFPALKAEWERRAKLSSGPLFVVGESAPVTPIGLLETGELLVAGANGQERRLSSEEVSLRFEPSL